MSQEIFVVAFITPAPGKMERTKQLLAQLASDVQKHEPGVLSYRAYQQYDGTTEENVIVMEESYVDQAAFDAHANTSYFLSTNATAVNESLLSAPIDIRMIAPFTGFSR